MTDILLASPWAGRLSASLAPLPAGVSLVAAQTADEALALESGASVLIGMPRTISQDLVDSLPGLEWLQLLTAGADLISGLRLPAKVSVTTARGIHGPQIAELALFYMLGLLRDARGILERQRGRVWRPSPQPVLLKRKVLIVGVGSISEELAARCTALGMEVEGVSGSRASAPGFSHIWPMAELAEAAGQADFVVVLTPHRPETHHLVDASVLAAMKDTAILINLSRGQVVDEDAMIAALRQCAIAGAGLDVFEREPLPPDSPLWELDNVLLTPHVGGFSDILPDQLAPLLDENIARWFGQPRRPLLNLLSGD